ncbi:YqaA family protein [Roseococcus suduntuyensis]|uniref:Membrane protein YqaA with SNARE-associated domain n=1 Tax=Roseococcus suduntuyensis TaxID=455361 RepID=A0A840AE65_9PROT|nr:YqaA family protein [Roseococcus suduntuyensis]MBB3898846.1 membrane protein YqaA with SNARE-associated domain [Roseococcus suduntuyensis]
MTTLLALLSLFFVALGAASLLPMASEPVLIAMLLTAEIDPWLLVAVASLGNTLGSVINYVLGRLVERFRHRPWFPASEASLDRAQGWYRRWGRWSLLLSWAPIIGDPLTVVAGIMREPLWSFVLLVAIAKTGRYVALALITLGFV